MAPICIYNGLNCTKPQHEVRPSVFRDPLIAMAELNATHLNQGADESPVINYLMLAAGRPAVLESECYQQDQIQAKQHIAMDHHW